jgi:hypothetical protein
VMTTRAGRCRTSVETAPMAVTLRDRLGGLPHEYERAA